MRFIISISLIALFLSASLRDVGVYFHFLLYQDSIAKELCVNIDKPEMLCSGKCVLVDKINKVDSESPSPLLKIADTQKVNYILDQTPRICLAPREAGSRQERPSTVDDSYSSSYVAAIFEPPKAA